MYMWFKHASRVPIWSGQAGWPLVLLRAASLRTAHPNNFTLHFLGSSAIHQPVQCPFCACPEWADLLSAFLRTAHPNNLRLHTALPWFLGNKPSNVWSRSDEWLSGKSNSRHTFCIHFDYHQSLGHAKCPALWGFRSLFWLIYSLGT